MTVYVLVEIHEDEHCPILGVYTTFELAKAQFPRVTWSLNDDDTWIGSRPIGPWTDQSYEISPWETDEDFVVPDDYHQTYVRSPEEVAALQRPRFRGGVSSMGAYNFSASAYFRTWGGAVATPAEGTPEYESMLKAIEINKAQIERYRKEHPEPTEKETDTSDWKTRFDKLIKQVTEF